jgi:TRAP-type uncharacterized transport system fused permease subunit
MFWVSPTLLAQGELADILPAVATASAGVIMLACATEGWLLGPMAWPPRLLAGGAALLLMIPETLTDLGGLALGAALIALQWSRRART